MIEHGQGLPPTSNIPWDPAIESATRRTLTAAWAGFWTALVVMGVLAVKGKINIGFFVLVAAWIFSAFLVVQTVAYLRAMNANKPRDPAGLTQWEQQYAEAVRDDAEFPVKRFPCSGCGAVYEFSEGVWAPNRIDPGGGRFTLICPCGRGHFWFGPPRQGAQ